MAHGTKAIEGSRIVFGASRISRLPREDVGAETRVKFVLGENNEDGHMIT